CFKNGDGTRSAREIPLILQNVCNMDHLPGCEETTKAGFRVRMDNWIAPPFLQVRLRRAMKRNVPKCIALDQEQVSKFGSANPHRVFEHGHEHRLQLAGRA